MSIWMAALNLRPHSHQYIDVQPWGSCLQASLDQAGLDIILPAHYTSNGSYHALLPSGKCCPPKWQCVQKSRVYDDIV